jgi:hypothetical protein
LKRAAAVFSERVPGAAPTVNNLEVIARRAIAIKQRTELESWTIRRRLQLALQLSHVDGLELEDGTRKVFSQRHNPGSRKVICSFAMGAHVKLLSIAGETYKAYGERHGWDVVLSTEEELAERRPPSWAKIRLIRELLDDYDLVWWIDADALFTDVEPDIMPELDSDKDLFLVEHTWGSPPWIAANAGVMLWRSTEWSKNFLDEIWSTEKYIDYPIWENAALLELLGYNLFPIFHKAPTAHMVHVKFLPLAWNSVWENPADEPYLNHHGASIGNERTRRDRMRLDLILFRRTLAGIRPSPARSRATQNGSRRTYLTAARPSSTMVREDIPLMLNERGLVGCAAEVGVFAGQFSARLLSTWRGRHLISIDPWLAASPDEYVDVNNVSQPEHDANYEATRARLARFGERSSVWRLTSKQAAHRVPRASMDFVYIDARHDEQSVLEDLDLWLPKLRPGGILAGHDYEAATFDEGVFGVKTAVDSFFGRLGLRVHVTGEPKFPSWIVEIPADDGRQSATRGRTSVFS